MKVLISTDTSAVLTYDVFKKNELSVFALNVIVDGEEFLDGVTIDQDTLCKAMRSGKNIKTSTPPLGEVIEYFEKLFAEGYDQIIHFTISSKLSSMNELFNNVAKEHFAGKLFVVDSYALSTAMLSQVLYASEEVKKGTPVEQIIAELENRKLVNKVVFIPENLTALKNGGRISPAIALIGNVLGIKPTISLTDGELQKEGTTKQVRKFLIESAENLANQYSTEEYDYTLVNFDGKVEVLEYIAKEIEKIIGEGKLVQGILPINVCAHCGPGTIGLIVSKKINGKSIKEFL